MITRLRHIRTARKVLANGTTATYYYHRHTNKRIHGEPGTAEFLENYQEASIRDPKIGDGSLKNLIREYKASTSFSKLKPRTRIDYDSHLIKIEEKWGTVPLKVFEDIRIRKDLLQWRDKLAERSAKQADYTWSVFRRIIQFAVHNGELGQNHLKNPGQLYKPNRTDKIWLPADVEAFMEKAGSELQLALMLALHTGQRKGDLLRLTWTSYDGVGISLTQSKSGRKVYIPVTSTLKSILDQIPREAVSILTNTRKLCWTSDGFNSSWRKTALKAGITDLTFHDLRGTAITILAEQGCSSLEIASITGHSLKHVETILDAYASRTKKIAQAAIARFEKSWVNNVSYGKERTKMKQK